MTRWARSGNTQKHKKMPGDATSWEDFSKPSKTKSKFCKKNSKNKKAVVKNVQSGFVHSHKKKLSKFPETSFEESPILNCNSEYAQVFVNYNRNEKFPVVSIKNQSSASDKNLVESPKRKKRKSKQHVKDIKIEIEEAHNSHSDIKKSCSYSENKNSVYEEVQTEDDCNVLQLSCKIKSRNDMENMSEKQMEKLSRKKEQKLLKQKMKSCKSTNVSRDNSVLDHENLDKKNNNNIENDTPILGNQKCSEGSISVEKNSTSDTEKKKKKKLNYMEKLRRRRAEKGIILLPAKVERKLYNIRKILKEKGMPVEVLKDILRKERRKEELKFRKTFSSKICFNCRQTGHVLAECPVPIGPSSKKPGSCFKCGSEEHTSYKCPNKITGYPLAICFICKQQGHISRNCPQNSHGIYPKGGKCNLCGNINHLKKDCPSLKKKGEENTMTVHAITEGTSIDAEIVNKDNVLKEDKKHRKPKVVKF